MSFFVFQLAQTGTSISFPKPFLRCIGFENTLDDARVLAKAAFDEKKMETRIMPSLKVFLAGKTKYEGLDLPRREEEQQKANAMVDEWIANREQIIKGVEEDARSRKILPDPAFSEAVKEKDIEPDDEIQVYKKGFFAIAIIPDAEEPAVIPLAFSTSLALLQEQMKELSVSEDFKHFDMFADECGKWMPLHAKATKVAHHDPLRQEVQGMLK
jgi:hypothetical protein